MESSPDPLRDTGVFYPVPASQSPDPRRTQPSSPPEGQPPRLPQRGTVTVRGVVRARSDRTEQQTRQYPDGHWGETSITVVSFRLDLYDQAGNRPLSVPVEMRGPSFTGRLEDGDLVGITGEILGGVLHASLAENLSNGAQFALRQQDKRKDFSLKRILELASMAVGLAMIASFAHFFFGLASHIPDVSPPSLPGFTKAAHKRIVMPNLVGEQNTSIDTLMDRAGYTETVNILEDSTPAPDAMFGRVVKTVPKAGTKMWSDDLVRVYIGRGGN